MSAAVDVRSLIAEIGGAQPVGAKVKTVLARVAEVSGLGERRVRALWNGEAKRIEFDEIERLRAAAALEAERQLAELDARRARLAALARGLRT